MSNIERNFVLDNGTVKDNISYNPKYYVIGDNTEDYRRIGDIPVSGNYEPNLPYPLDARTLVPKVEYLTDTNWWRTAFGIDTVLYKGMLVTCVDTHQTYIYDGETKNIRLGELIYATDWKCQRIDKSLVKWPIDEDENEIIRIGADVINLFDSSKGLYITNSSTLKGPSFYISDKFISFGKNSTDNDNNIYPFVPYDLIDESNYENLKNDYYTTQTGIFIPTADNNKEKPLTIYSNRGINIANYQGILSNQIEFLGDGYLNIFTRNNLNLNTSANLNVNTDASLHLNVSNNLEANIGNNIAINANTADIKFSGNYSKETSAYLLNSSTFTLKTLTDVSIKASGLVYVNYAAGVKIFGNTDDKSVFNITPNYVELKTSNNVNINSADSDIILSAKNGKVRIDSSALDVSAKNLANIKAKEFLVNAGKFGFNYDTDATKYSKIDGSTGFLTLAAKGANGESKIVLETGEAGSDGRIINITSNTINLNDLSTYINTDEFILTSGDKTLFTIKKSTPSIPEDIIELGNTDTTIRINGLPFPHADSQTSGILQLLDGNKLRWSKDIGVHHANEKGSVSNVVERAFVRVATINWELESDGTPKSISETIILSISDNKDSEIFAIKITYDENNYKSDILRLSHFSDSTTEYHEIRISNLNNKILIYVKALSNQFAWNGLAYSSNCTISETAKDVLPDLTTNIISSTYYKEVLFNSNIKSFDWKKDSLGSLIIPWPIHIGKDGNDNIKPNLAGFLKFARKANGEIGTLSWDPLDNQLKDIANNDAGTKVFIVGTERTGAAVSTCNEFYNNIRVYIDQYCNIFATAFYATSDERKKKDIKEIEFNDASILIPREYRFKDSDKKAYGFIAQEVEKAGYTDIVNTDEETGDKTLDYNSAFAIALALMQAKIKQLEDEIKELKNK